MIGPSNPVISIGPILELAGMREALAGARAPVVAVSPFVGGRTLKGPTDHFCAWAEIAPNAEGIARAYAGVIDAMVADEAVDGMHCVVTDTLLDTPERRRRVAEEIVVLRNYSRGMSTLAILPVKTFGAAKQRLAPALPGAIA